jgi:hypothetical protein
VLKEDRRIHTQQHINNPPTKKESHSRLVPARQQQTSVNQSAVIASKRKIFETKYKKFLDFKSPEKREVSAGERKSVNSSSSQFNEQIRNQLDKISTAGVNLGNAIKSKEEWFELENQSDELNDTR